MDEHNVNTPSDHASPRHPRRSAATHRPLAPRSNRFGATIRSLLLFTCGAVFLGASAMILDPATLLAGSSPVRDDAAAYESRRRDFVDALSGLISDSADVLAVHQRGPTPYAEIVLWVHDNANPGVIDPNEIAVISHSRPLHAVTIYSLAGTNFWANAPTNANSISTSAEKRLVIPASDRTARNAAPVDSRPTTAGRHGESPSETRSFASLGRLTRESLAQPAFCDKWRALPAVQPRTIAAGISDMKILNEAGDAESGVGGPELSVLRLSLTWLDDSTDSQKAGGQASAVVDRARHRQSVQE